MKKKIIRNKKTLIYEVKQFMLIKESTYYRRKWKWVILNE